MTEEELITGCIANDNKAITQFYYKYKPVMRIISRKYFNSIDDVNELTQLSFIKVINNLNSYSGPYLKAWICRITRNMCIDYIRVKKTKKKTIHDIKYGILDDAFQDVDNINQTNHNFLIDDNDFDDNIEYQNNKEKQYIILENEIEKLTPAYKSAIKLHYYENMSFKKIAIQLNVSENSVKANCCKARKKIKKNIEENFYN